MVLIGFLLIGGECGDAGGVGGLDNGVKVEGYGLVGLVAEDMQAIDMAIGKIHAGYRAGGENQAGIVDMHRAVGVGEALLVKLGELVVLDMPVGVGLLGEAALDDRAENGGGVLHGLEERSLPQLRLRLVVVERHGLAATELLAKASVEDTVADGTRLLYDGWSDLCHNIFVTEEQYI